MGFRGHHIPGHRSPGDEKAGLRTLLCRNPKGILARRFTRTRRCRDMAIGLRPLENNVRVWKWKTDRAIHRKSVRVAIARGASLR